MRNLTKTKVSLPMLIEGAETEAKELKFRTRSLRNYVRKLKFGE